MKIIYDDKQEMYYIELEYPENIVCVNTKDIVEAKKYLIENITVLFNNAINERFQKTFDDALEDVKKICNDAPHAVVQCISEVDHEWECCGISTEGTHYRCKKCNAHKIYPV